jgi:drug/metabolite transporter (DMT)-like permease
MSAPLTLLAGALAALATAGMHYLGVAPLGRVRPQYRIHWWWDALAHALGGFAVAVAALTVFSYASAGPLLAVATVATVLVVGLAWEVYELVFWGEAEKVSDLLYREDTTLDIVLELNATYALLLIHQYVPLTP